MLFESGANHIVALNLLFEILDLGLLIEGNITGIGMAHQIVLFSNLKF